MKIFDIIKYEASHHILVWKFPGEDFNTLSQLIVHETQEAVFFKDGKALDLFGPGRYTLHSQNIPLIRKLINLPFNGESPFHCEIYFINKAVSMDIDWHTKSPLPIQDAKYGIVLPISSSGQMGVKVVDSKLLLKTLVGTENVFTQETIQMYFKGLLLTNIKDYIAAQFAQKQISFLEIHAHIKSISNGIKNALRADFLSYGMELVHFNIYDIIPPENDPSYIALKNALAKKAEMSVIGYSYQQERAFDVLGAAAANEGSASNIMGAGMGLGMGANLGNVIGGMMGETIQTIQTPVSPTAPEKTAGICSECGSSISDGAKFCAGCGKKIIPNGQIVCPECDALNPTNSRFCFQCGNALIRLCKNCGAQTIQDARFCLICGNRLD